VAEMTGETRVVALDRLWPGDIADRSGDLLDIVFSWADFAKLRRLVTGIGGSTLIGLGVTRERVREWLVPVLEQLAEAKRQAG
jgi:hypothetical protein